MAAPARIGYDLPLVSLGGLDRRSGDRRLTDDGFVRDNVAEWLRP